jgi:hypothetical protein
VSLRCDSDREKRELWMEVGVRPSLIQRVNQPMRLRRFRLSVRSVLAAIAVIATVMAISIAEGRRRREYWDQYNFHLQQLEGSSPPLALGFWS